MNLLLILGKNKGEWGSSHKFHESKSGCTYGNGSLLGRGMNHRPSIQFGYMRWYSGIVKHSNANDDIIRENEE